MLFFSQKLLFLLRYFYASFCLPEKHFDARMRSIISFLSEYKVLYKYFTTFKLTIVVFKFLSSCLFHSMLRLVINVAGYSYLTLCPLQKY